MGKEIRKYFIPIINCLIFSLSGNFAYSQSVISGTVKDTLERPVPYVNVFLKPQNEDGIVAFATTQENGSYELMTNEMGAFEITFSSISFKKTTIPILLERNKKYRLNVVLKEEPFALDEVIINSDRAVILKKDTIIFKADAFKRGNEETVEDLLKNIPGITVDSDGKIKVGEREIEKLMVEGDDLFEKGYKMLTNNLDASTVNKVEVYEKYSNNRLLKGVEDSERVALNLTLKNNVKNKLFGAIKPGYGLVSENKYDASASIISFRKDSKLYGFTNFNNIGIKTSTALSKLMESGDDSNLGSIKLNQSSASFIDLINYQPDVGEERTNFNNAEMASLNNIYSLGSKIKLKTIGFLNLDENKFFRQSTDMYFLPTGNLTTTEDYQLYRKILAGFAHTQLIYDNTKNEVFEYSGKYSGNRLRTNTELLFNNDFSREYLNEDPFTTNQRFKYTNKLRPNKVLLLDGYYLYASNPQKYDNDSFLFNGLFHNGDQVNGVSQESNNTINAMGFDASLFSRKANNDLWTAKIGVDYSADHYISRLGLLEIDENPVGFQNNSKYKQFNIFLEPSYRLKMGSVALKGNIRLVQNATSFKTEDQTLDSSPFFINPKITLNWKINENNRIASSFTYEEKNPSVRAVQNGYVLTQYNVFSKGLQNTKPLTSSTFFINYTLGNILSVFYANTSFIYVKSHDYLGSKSIITQNYTLNELILLKNKKFLNLQTDSNIYLQSLSSNLKFKLGYNTQNFENSVNGNFRSVSISTYNYGAELKSAFTGPFNFHVGTEWFQSIYNTSMKQESTRNRSFIDIVYQPVDKLVLSMSASKHYFSDLDKDNNTYNFMDFEAKYPLIKNKFSVSLVGKNLLNTRRFREVNVSDIGIFKSEFQLLPRFLMLKINIRF